MSPESLLKRGVLIIVAVTVLGTSALIIYGNQPEAKMPCHRGLTLNQFVALHPEADEDDFAIYTATTPTLEIWP